MRRALRDIVPQEILERRRKAYLIRNPILALRNARSEIKALLQESMVSDLGLVNHEGLLQSLDAVSNGMLAQDSFVLMRAVSYEIWLRANHSKITFAGDGTLCRNTDKLFLTESQKFLAVRHIQ